MGGGAHATVRSGRLGGAASVAALLLASWDTATAQDVTGREKLRAFGDQEQDVRWAAELTDCVLAIDATNADAKRLKARALTEPGERQTSANARNYYLSVAQYLVRDLPPQ